MSAVCEALDANLLPDAGNQPSLVLEQLKKAGRLPSPAGVALRVLELSSSDEASVDDIAHALQADPVLAGRVIRAANSVTQGRRAVLSVVEAVIRLGIRPVRQLVLGVSLIEQTRANACTTFDYPRYWSRCLATAVAASHLARTSRCGSPDDCFTLALLHDIGSLALAAAYPRDYGALLDSGTSRLPQDLVSAERARFGVTSVDISRMLLRDWLIPESLITVAVDRDRALRGDDTRLRQLATLMQLAVDIGRSFVPCAGDPPLTGIQDRIHEFGVPAPDTDGFLTGIHEEHEAWCRDLNISTAVIPMESLLNAAIETHHSDFEENLAATLPIRVVLVEEHGPQRAGVRAMLESFGALVHVAEDPAEALSAHAVEPADLYLVNVASRAFDGMALCRRLRRSTMGDRCVIIGTAIETGPERQAQAELAGLDELIAKPLAARDIGGRLRLVGRLAAAERRLADSLGEVRRTTERLTEVNLALARAANTDVLTGLPNRRRILDRLQMEWEACAGKSLPCSVVVVDLDHFKLLNDRCGHDVGDLVLEGVAPLLQESIRPVDIVGRLGGEEFIVVCPGADCTAALALAERIRVNIEQHRFPLGTETVRITASLGVATATAGGAPQRWGLALRLADHAMYEAKRNGRNRVTVATVT